METKGLNILTLAQKAEMAVGTVQKLLTYPTCNPAIMSLKKISQALDTSISQLIGQTDKVYTLPETIIPLFEWELLENTLFSFQKN